MLRIIPFLFLVLCGPVLGGPLTNFHGNMTDQELFWGTDQYDFSVVVPAAGLECFWHFAHRGERFYLSFMVQWVTGVGHDRHVSVTMCFSNFHNRFGTMQVFLSFDGYKDSDKTKEEEEKEEASKDLNNTLSVKEESVQKLQNQIFHMWRHCNFARMRKGKDHYLLQSIFNYVTWWSATQSLVIIVSGYLQLFAIKRLFKTNSGGPRC
ncbi:hypothetical protein CgunFtcFv8_012560 [Champsocephalus gunnari]|uniref:GOLD domain-containing protein n=1 Tax=Champsocephalus gunnari TaxID=52237 RepID=A0AAN8HXX8_CHAGU|nr:hypothetical protein CgunFtcFv8_012560 [Champsocephalus gunnari]